MGDLGADKFKDLCAFEEIRDGLKVIVDGWKTGPFGEGEDELRTMEAMIEDCDDRIDFLMSGERHSDDDAVDSFAIAMKAKMKDSRENKGRSGWDNEIDCPSLFLACELLRHSVKTNAGTFEDIANFAMMLHQRGVDPKVLEDARNVVDAEQLSFRSAISKFELYEVLRDLMIFCETNRRDCNAKDDRNGAKAYRRAYAEIREKSESYQ